MQVDHLGLWSRELSGVCGVLGGLVSVSPTQRRA